MSIIAVVYKNEQNRISSSKIFANVHELQAQLGFNSLKTNDTK